MAGAAQAAIGMARRFHRHVDAIERRLPQPLRDFGEGSYKRVDDRPFGGRIALELSAVPGDDVEMVVRLVGTGKTASTWNLEIMRSGESLVKDHITALWVNDAGEPVRW